MLQFKKDAILAIKIKYDSSDPSLQLSWTDLGIIPFEDKPRHMSLAVLFKSPFQILFTITI